MTDVKHVQIDCRRIVHHIGVMLTSKDVTRATHVGRKLINLVEAAIDDRATDAAVPQVPFEPGFSRLRKKDEIVFKILGIIRAA